VTTKEMMAAIDEYVTACGGVPVKLDLDAEDRIKVKLEELWAAAYSDGQDDGRDDGYQEGARDASEAKRLQKNAETAKATAERFVDLICDRFGWDRFDKAKFLETGIVPAVKP